MTTAMTTLGGGGSGGSDEGNDCWVKWADRCDGGKDQHMCLAGVDCAVIIAKLAGRGMTVMTTI